MMEKMTITAYGLTTRVRTKHPDWGYGCSECCNKDRCDRDCDAKYERSKCPHCNGQGWIPEEDVTIKPNPDATKS